jgi:hypothetical protein
VTARTELEEYVYQFVERNKLFHRLEILLFGARLARDKHGAMRRYGDEITEPEKDLIRNEKDKKTGFWSQAKFFKATSMAESLYKKLIMLTTSSHYSQSRRYDPRLDTKCRWLLVTFWT